MSLFQCERCGCCENTALSNYYWRKMKNLPLLCSACDDDPFYKKGGEWHNRFERVFLPKGMFVTNKDGNLAHRETGDTDYMKSRIFPSS